jgi:DNA-binding Lrp family transcriptional regulator
MAFNLGIFYESFGIMTDDLDKTLLSALAVDARISVATLARRLDVARTTVQARLERLERNGTIAAYTVKLGEAARLNRIRATVLMQVEPRATAMVLARLKTMVAVEVVHTSSGRFDMVLQLACENTTALDQALDDIGEIKGVRSSESLIHLATKIDRAL